MLAAAWTLQDNGHVRVDVFYADASPRAKALVESIGPWGSSVLTAHMSNANTCLHVHLQARPGHRRANRLAPISARQCPPL